MNLIKHLVLNLEVSTCITLQSLGHWEGLWDQYKPALHLSPVTAKMLYNQTGDNNFMPKHSLAFVWWPGNLICIRHVRNKAHYVKVRIPVYAVIMADCFMVVDLSSFSPDQHNMG